VRCHVDVPTEELHLRATVAEHETVFAPDTNIHLAGNQGQSVKNRTTVERNARIGGTQGEAERAPRCRSPSPANRPHFEADSIDSAIPRPKEPGFVR
jgi:hypothetical protein